MSTLILAVCEIYFRTLLKKCNLIQNFLVRLGGKEYAEETKNILVEKRTNKELNMIMQKVNIILLIGQSDR